MKISVKEFRVQSWKMFGTLQTSSSHNNTPDTFYVLSGIWRENLWSYPLRRQDNAVHRSWNRICNTKGQSASPLLPWSCVLSRWHLQSILQSPWRPRLAASAGTSLSRSIILLNNKTTTRLSQFLLLVRFAGNSPQEFLIQTNKGFVTYIECNKSFRWGLSWSDFDNICASFSSWRSNVEQSFLLVFWSTRTHCIVANTFKYLKC